MSEDSAFHAMRQSLVDRGYLGSDFRLTEAGSAYSLEVMARVAAREPKNPKVAEWVKEWPEAPVERPDMRSMGSPDYAYQPLSGDTRAKMSAAQRERLGITAGHRRVYGVNVPEAVAEVLRPLATEIAGKRGPKEATAFVLNAQANGWRHDPSLVPVKQKNVWTPERRKKVSERVTAMHARRRAEREETIEAKPSRTEEPVNVQAKVAAPVRDDGIRQVHGVGCVDGNKERKRVIVRENDALVVLEVGYELRLLTKEQARYLADHLYDLAIRVDRRASAMA